MRNEKLREVSVSYFSRADDYSVVMGTLGMKYGEQQRMQIVWYHKFEFKIAVG